MAGSLVDAMVAYFDSVFIGPNGDYPSVEEVLLGITAEEALWKPEPAQNSIWQIVEHLTDSKDWQIEMLQEENPAPPVWVEPAGGEVEWQAALLRLRKTHWRLQAALHKLAEAELLQMPVPEWGRTRLELLLSSGPAHEAHHCGQIDYIKGLLRNHS